MRVLRAVASVLVMLAAIPAAAWAADPARVMGAWWTQDRDGVIQIYACPSGVCGRVIGIKDFHADGSPPTDLHGRSRCHLQIIPGGTVDSDGVWDSHITNPDNDKTYTITLQTTPDGRLRMRGYIGLPLFGQTVYWTPFHDRVTPDCHIQG